MEAERLELATSPAAIDEFLDVVSRPRLRDAIEAADAAALVHLLRHVALFHPTAVTRVCRDPSDDYLLALAEASRADVLVTRDEDLLLLRRHGDTEIIHTAALLQRIAQGT